jgi:chondroitin sulfate proteoglycan 4
VCVYESRYHWCRQVLRPPRYGALHPSTSVKHHRLQSGDTFTQQDLDSGRLRYRLHRKAYSHVHDDFTFRVSAPECVSVSGTLGLLHVPSGETRGEVRATLERLQVRESPCCREILILLCLPELFSYQVPC